jgi:putative DNA primase/helicase
MIQLLGLRSFIGRDGIEKTSEVFFERNWRAQSVPELFNNLSKYVEQIPKEERYNMFYTVAHCLEERGRKFESQEIIPIDIDDVDQSRIDEYVTLILRELDLNRDDVGIVYSGNGIHILIWIDLPFSKVEYFDEYRTYYKAICGRINQAMYMYGLQGQADPVVFGRGRLLRLPYTKNIKNGAEKDCIVINANMKPVTVEWEKWADIPVVPEGGYIHPNAVKRLPPPDNKGVLEGCDFIKWASENQDRVNEPQWYAMLSIVSRLDDGRHLGHEFSKLHPNYNKDKTDLKITQAMEAAGPRTCDNINTLWDGCGTCANYQKCKSPIMIKSEDYLRTKDSGFYDISYAANGALKRTPNYDDLVKYFDQCNYHVSMDDSGIVYIYDDGFWKECPKQRMHEFAELNFMPRPNNSMCVEFENKLKRTNLRNQEWFNPQGYVNFKNCVLELETGKVLEHSSEFGFRYILPYDYEPTAVCPRFDKFLDEVMLKDEEMKRVICEFMGYSLSGIDPVIGQKALILYGNGSNGKSVLLEVFKMLAGKGNYSTVSMGNEINKETGRYALSGKLFNITEETPRDAMVDNTIFKALVSGGEVQARRLYCDAFDMKNYAKIIMACNALPNNYDDTNGMYRRLLIVPFKATFTEETKDVFLIDKLRDELSGIFNLAYSGYKSFVKTNGRFTRAEQIEAQLTEYKQESHPLSFFIEEDCNLETDGFCTSMVLYTRYKTFSETTGMRPIDIRLFSKLMASYLHTVYGKDMKSRRDNTRGFAGINLKVGGDY